MTRKHEQNNTITMTTITKTTTGGIAWIINFDSVDLVESIGLAVVDGGLVIEPESDVTELVEADIGAGSILDVTVALDAVARSVESVVLDVAGRSVELDVAGSVEFPEGESAVVSERLTVVWDSVVLVSSPTKKSHQKSALS